MIIQSRTSTEQKCCLTTSRGISDIFRGHRHFHSCNFTHQKAQSSPDDSHFDHKKKQTFIRSTRTKKNPLFWLRSVQQQSTLVIRWTTQAQIRQQTFTPTFLYLLDLRWVSVGFVALFFTVHRSERLGTHWESCHFLAEVAAHVKKHVIPVYGQFGSL